MQSSSLGERPHPGSSPCGTYGRLALHAVGGALGGSRVPVPSLLRNNWISTHGALLACQCVGAGRVWGRRGRGAQPKGRPSRAGWLSGGQELLWALCWLMPLPPQQSSTCMNATTAPACASAPSGSCMSTLWPMTASPSASALARSVPPIRWVLVLSGHATAALGWARTQGGRPRDQCLGLGVGLYLQATLCSHRTLSVPTCVLGPPPTTTPPNVPEHCSLRPPLGSFWPTTPHLKLLSAFLLWSLEHQGCVGSIPGSCRAP